MNSKNFVLCPGKAYDRSPCGTGTSAKLACLYADGKLREGQVWRQESIVGSVFEGTVAVRDGKFYPSIKGSAFVNAESDLVLDPRRSSVHGYSWMKLPPMMSRSMTLLCRGWHCRCSLRL